MVSDKSNDALQYRHEELTDKFEDMLDYVKDAYKMGKAAHDVELGIFKKVLEIGFIALSMYFRMSGNGDQGEQLTLPDGRVVRRLKNLHMRGYLSIFGLFELERMVYGTRENQKIQWVPLDAKLSLPESKFSYVLQDWSQEIASGGPFNQVNEVLGKILGITQSVNSLERTNRKMSDSTETFWGQKSLPVAEDEGALMIFQTDGKGVVMRPEAETSKANKPTAPVLHAKKEKEKNGKKKMALVGASYTVDPHIRTPEQILDALFRSSNEKPPSLARPTPVAKHVRASLLRDTKGTMKPSYDEIFDWQAQELKLRNPNDTKPIIFIMDGQDSLWQALPKYFPDTEIISILDIIHATSYVWDAAHLFYTKGSSEATGFAKERIRRILNGGVEGVIRGLRWKGTYHCFPESQVNKLETICGYLENNRHRMAYDEYLAAGYPIASGVIEGACRNIIVDRMEHSGMRWVMDGAHAMLQLRCIKLSGLWDEFNGFRIKQECKRLYLGYAANDECYVEVA